MRRILTVTACALLAFVPAARAAVSVGQSFVPASNCTNAGTLLQTGVASGASYTVPAAGVITSWSFHDGSAIVPDLEFKVGRQVNGDEWQIVGTSAAGAQAPNTAATYPVRISVHAGDVLGIYENGGICGSMTGSASDTYESITSTNEPLYATATYNPQTHGLFPVSAEVEPDADGDGFGDETQDRCPGVPGDNGGCPPSPPPPPKDTSKPVVSTLIGKTLKLTKGAISFFMTADENAAGTATGTVNLPKAAKVIRFKSATVKLAPGDSTKITLKLSRRNLTAVRKALARHRLRATITVSVSDGAGNRTIKQFRVGLR